MTIEELQALLKEKDEKLKEATEKVGEFRDSNIELKKNVEDLTKKISGIDIDEYQKLKTQAQEQKDKDLISAGKLDELVEEKVNAIRTEQQNKISELEQTNSSLTANLDTLVVDNAVKSVAIAAGVNNLALDDVMARARGIWKAKDGKPVAVDKDGNTVWYKGTTEPLTMEKWITELNATAPHLFNTSTGTRSTVSNATGGGKTLTRDAFDKLGQAERAAFVKDGGSVV
jgi:hypothetical protein